MRIKLLLISLIVSLITFSQESLVILKSDTLLPFFGTSSLRLYGYENRIVPYKSKAPLYVFISYEGVKSKRFEYFRIDSSKYLVYEFFRNSKGSSNKGLKGRGVVHVINKIIDSSASYGNLQVVMVVPNKHTTTKSSPKKENGMNMRILCFFTSFGQGNMQTTKRLVFGVITSMTQMMTV